MGLAKQACVLDGGGILPGISLALESLELGRILIDLAKDQVHELKNPLGILAIKRNAKIAVRHVIAERSDYVGCFPGEVLDQVLGRELIDLLDQWTLLDAMIFGYCFNNRTCHQNGRANSPDTESLVRLRRRPGNMGWHVRKILTLNESRPPFRRTPGVPKLQCDIRRAGPIGGNAGRPCATDIEAKARIAPERRLQREVGSRPRNDIGGLDRHMRVHTASTTDPTSQNCPHHSLTC